MSEHTEEVNRIAKQLKSTKAKCTSLERANRKLQKLLDRQEVW